MANDGWEAGTRWCRFRSHAEMLGTPAQSLDWFGLVAWRLSHGCRRLSLIAFHDVDRAGIGGGFQFCHQPCLAYGWWELLSRDRYRVENRSLHGRQRRRELDAVAERSQLSDHLPRPHLLRLFAHGGAPVPPTKTPVLVTATRDDRASRAASLTIGGRRQRCADRSSPAQDRRRWSSASAGGRR
jgi:hypothetical protein